MFEPQKTTQVLNILAVSRWIWGVHDGDDVLNRGGGPEKMFGWELFEWSINQSRKPHLDRSSHAERRSDPGKRSRRGRMCVWEGAGEKIWTGNECFLLCFDFSISLPTQNLTLPSQESAHRPSQTSRHHAQRRLTSREVRLGWENWAFLDCSRMMGLFSFGPARLAAAGQLPE